MSTSADLYTADYPRLVWDQDQSPAELDIADAALAAGIARAALAMAQLVATIRQTGYATEPRRAAIELALTQIDEQMMHATRALFALPTDPRAAAPLQVR